MSKVSEIENQVKRYERQMEGGKLPKPERCAVCKKGSKFYAHGRYQRQLLTPRRNYTLTIRRLLCRICEHTFGLLPSFVAKFHRYSKDFIETVLKKLKFLSYEKAADWVMESWERYISPGTLVYWEREFASGYP